MTPSLKGCEDDLDGMTEHVDFVSLRGVARLSAMDARQAQAIEAQRAATTGAVEDESADPKGIAQNVGDTSHD